MNIFKLSSIPLVAAIVLFGTARQATKSKYLKP